MKQLKSKTKLVARFLLVAVIGLSVLSGCKSYDKEVDGLNADISTLKTDLQTLKTQTEANLAAKVAELNTKIDGLNTKIADLTAKGATKAEVEALKTELLNTLATKASLDAYKTSTDARLATIDAKIAALEAKKTVTPEELAAAKAELDGKIQATNTALAALSAKVTSLETTLTAKDNELATLIGQLQARAATLEGLVALKADKTAVDAVKSDLAALTTRVAANETKIANILTTISTLATKAELQALANRVTGTETAITTINTALVEINKDLEDLQKELGIKFLLLSHRLTSLEYVSDFYVNGIEAMNFSPLMSSCKAITPAVTVAYHLNPSTITKEDIKFNELSFAVLKGKNVVSYNGYGPAPEADSRIKAGFVKIENGKIYVSVSVIDYPALLGATSGTGSNISGSTLTEIFNQVALEVPLADKVLAKNEAGQLEQSVVTSEYVRLYSEEIVAGQDVKLARNNKPTYSLLPTTVAGAKALNVNGVDGFTGSNDPQVVTLPYGQTLDLNKEVLAIMGGMPFDENGNYGLKFKFDLLHDENYPSINQAIVYNRGSNNTDQQKFIEITDAAKGTIKAKVFTAQEIAAAQGRTPIVRVWMYNDQDPNCKVLVGYVKVLIADKPAPAPIEITIPFTAKTADCNNWTGIMTVEQVNTLIYNAVGLSKEQFHGSVTPPVVALYPSSLFSYTGDGVVAEKYTPDNQQTDTYLLNWTLTAAQIWTKLASSNPANFAATAVYKSILPLEYPEVRVKFTMSFSKPADLNIPASKKISNYWYTNTAVSPNPYVKHNVFVPNVNETNSALAIFSNNINQAFEQTSAKALNITLPNPYEYFFLPTQPVLGNGTQLIVSANGKQLIHQATSEVIATINAYATNVGDVLVLNKTSNKAKELLNVSPEHLIARIGLRTVYCANLPQYTQAITIDGKSFFDVVFIRPINALQGSSEKFVDGKNFGEAGTYVDIQKLVNLADWRNNASNVSTFAAYPWFYQYYGVTAITVNTATIKTNLGGGANRPLTDFPDLEVAFAASIAGVTPVSPTGYLTYRNNGNTLGVDFKLFADVTITYTWGVITYPAVEIPVAKTVGPAGVKRK